MRKTRSHDSRKPLTSAAGLTAKWTPDTETISSGLTEENKQNWLKSILWYRQASFLYIHKRLVCTQTRSSLRVSAIPRIHVLAVAPTHTLLYNCLHLFTSTHYKPVPRSPNPGEKVSCLFSDVKWLRKTCNFLSLSTFHWVHTFLRFLNLWNASRKWVNRLRIMTSARQKEASTKMCELAAL